MQLRAAFLDPCPTARGRTLSNTQRDGQEPLTATIFTRPVPQPPRLPSYRGCEVGEPSTWGLAAATPGGSHGERPWGSWVSRSHHMSHTEGQGGRPHTADGNPEAEPAPSTHSHRIWWVARWCRASSLQAVGNCLNNPAIHLKHHTPRN